MASGGEVTDWSWVPIVFQTYSGLRWRLARLLCATVETWWCNTADSPYVQIKGSFYANKNTMLSLKRWTLWMLYSIPASRSPLNPTHTAPLNITHWQKRIQYSCLECSNHLCYCIHSPTVFNPKKTSLTPVGLVIKTKEIFPPLEKDAMNERQDRIWKGKICLF